MACSVTMEPILGWVGSTQQFKGLAEEIDAFLAVFFLLGYWTVVWVSRTC